jgi:N-formylmaleamate deformylase
MYSKQQYWLEDTVVANGIRQHYYRTGGDKPVLVLLHGFSENGLVWSRVARALEGEYDVVMVDARGHGRSDGPEHGYGQEMLNQDVAELIRVLGLDRPTLIGHSNGALTAAQVVAHYPELVRAVVLEDPPWTDVVRRPPAMAENSGGEPWPGYTAWLNSWTAWHRALRTQTPEERIASSQQFLPPGAENWPEEVLLAHLEAQAQFNLAVLDHVPPVPGGSPWRETVERIACPILLLTGNPARGAGITPQLAEKVAATWKQGQLVYFENAGHFMHYELQGEQFDRFIDVIKVFLAGL